MFQTAFLHRARVVQVLHLYGLSLPDAPASSACLTQYVDRISRLGEDQRWKLKQVETSLNQLWMADADLHPSLQVALIPGLPLLRRNFGRQHLGPDTFLGQQPLEAARDIAGACVDRVPAPSVRTRVLRGSRPAAGVPSRTPPADPTRQERRSGRIHVCQ
jgi:hypothetical protein